jgi:hypothetical protein
MYYTIDPAQRGVKQIHRFALAAKEPGRGTETFSPGS